MRRAVLAAAIVTAVAFVSTDAQQPTFSTRVEVVRVDVSVMRGRRPVADLKASDFEIFDNGVRQDIVGASTEPLPLDVVLALDVSGSVEGAKLRELREAAEAFMAGLVNDDEVALLTFSHELSLLRDLTADRAAIATALQKPLAGGGTALRDGIYAALALRRSQARRDVVLVCTDGVDSGSWLTEDQLRTAANRANALLYIVGLPPLHPDRRLTVREVMTQGEISLTRLAESTGGRVWRAESSDWLKRAFLEVLDEIRTRYVLTYNPTGVAAGGWHALDVRVKRSGLTLKAREGYFADPALY